MRNLLFILSLSGLMSCQPSGNQSQTYPHRPLTYIVPWSPGGGTDIASRTMAAVLQDALGQPVNVVNRAGGSGIVGHLALSQARPDGYTIGAITVEITMLHWQGLTDLSYENYTTLGLLTNNFASVTVRNDAPWNTLEELLDDIRANPGKYKASGTGKGGIWDLARAGFLQAADLPVSAMPWVPSQGAAPALQELIAGGVEVVTAALVEVDALQKAGQVKVLAVMAPERLPSFPEIPTLKEQGVDWSLGGWVGIGAPKDLPAEIVTRLDSAMQLAMKDEAFVSVMKKAGYYLQPMDAATFGSFMKDQDVLNGDLMKSAGIVKEE